jgi:hypothetical protein
MLRLTLSLAALLAAVLPATAQAGFQINRSMEGVHIGMTRDAVRERLGAPAEERGRRLALRVRRRPAALLRRELRYREAQHGLRYASPPGDVRHDLAQHAVALGV